MERTTNFICNHMQPFQSCRSSETNGALPSDLYLEYCNAPFKLFETIEHNRIDILHLHVPDADYLRTATSSRNSQPAGDRRDE
jgi:hypothetical protein